LIGAKVSQSFYAEATPLLILGKQIVLFRIPKGGICGKSNGKIIVEFT
jgi:hypothetical protein